MTFSPGDRVSVNNLFTGGIPRLSEGIVVREVLPNHSWWRTTVYCIDFSPNYSTSYLIYENHLKLIERKCVNWMDIWT